MELINQPKATSTLTTSQAEIVEIEANAGRTKTKKYLNELAELKECKVQAIPTEKSRKMLYKLYMKIGATSELPSNKEYRDSMLNDFWRVLYLTNNLVPGDIPFFIIIEEFTDAVVRGEVGKMYHNQASICKAFNEWIKSEDVRNRLYQVRDREFPSAKPKQLKDSNDTTIKDWSVEELKKELEKTNKQIESGLLEGLKFPHEWKAKLESELKSRNNPIKKEATCDQTETMTRRKPETTE